MVLKSKKSTSSIEKLAMDSGYLSDLTNAERQSQEAATRFFRASSPRGYSSGLVLGAFNDTKWDIAASQPAKIAALKKQCQDLAKDIKTPTRFPIVPFASTVARVQAEEAARDRRGRKKRSASTYGDDLRDLAEKRRATVVDTRGRTRAASRKQAATRSAEPGRSQTALEQQNGIGVGPRGRRRWEEDGGYEKTEMPEKGGEVWKGDEAREPGKTYDDCVQEDDEARDDNTLLEGC